jgi:hypothetical protein
VNRVLSWVGAACVGGLIVVVLGGAYRQEKPGRVEATEFLLRDDQGRARASLTVAGGSPRLVMMDEKGMARVRLTIRSEIGGHLHLKATKDDREGLGYVAISFRADGTPIIEGVDAKEKVVFKLPAPAGR